MSEDSGFLPYDPADLDHGMASKDLLDLFDQVNQDVMAWRPQDGNPQIGGTVTDISEAGSDFGTYPLLTIRTPSGKYVTVHAFHTVLQNELNRRIASGRLKVGDTIAIAYKGEGEAKAGRTAPEMYRVAVKPTN